MKTKSIQPNQSLPDMAIMACGTLEGAMAIMRANNTSLSNTAITGTTFAIPDDATVDAGALRYLEQNEIVIGTR